MAREKSWWDAPKLEVFGGSDKDKHSEYGNVEPWDYGNGAGRCYHNHKPLQLGSTGLVIHGGSCSDPIVKDADVYIGFDAGMKFTDRQFPWNPGHEILYTITDFAAPKEVTQFRKLVDWTAEQLQAGAKVHCGCIGGHGRTGTFLAALVKHMLDVDDAVTYVREHYCKKAVESEKQIDYLARNFGIKPIKGAKEFVHHANNWTKAGSGTSHGSSSPRANNKFFASPVVDGNSIWGKRRI